MVNPEPLTLYTTDGVRIDAGHTPFGGEVCFILAHGFTCSWRLPALRRIAAALGRHGGVIALDFRGHGRSGGHSTVGDREVLDVDAAVAAARRRGYERVVLTGFSMGGAIVVRHAALYGGVDAVVSVSAPARWYYRETVPMRRVHWAIERRAGRMAVRLARGTRIAPKGWDPVPEAPHEVAGRIAPAPLLVVHGAADPFFPVEHGHQLYEAASDPRELWIEPAFGHAEVAATPDLINRLAAWATKAVSATPAPSAPYAEPSDHRTRD
ncbi:pimeloyl-ACP methyl ester carboxylesterase [Actinomadura luteofluorescens]|uniref:Pimeloyl-ACP methyl ester carboxylesterase n=1 Tax=Actinomadura luteofluorescens TaxID=46163 RepID=A0A7Y9ECS4_9ACTN|nr:alpha/beta fold hydrolase [Actinomadura luteofluorescens]NYD45091.1 pimeloyl-ACP methyl ester carboxylesterase [Actinomadura luteofluorescens]